jgi:hypothetical protein
MQFDGVAANVLATLMYTNQTYRIKLRAAPVYLRQVRTGIQKENYKGWVRRKLHLSLLVCEGSNRAQQWLQPISDCALRGG